MTNFYTRLNKYYSDVAKVLRGEAEAAAIFPNSSDIGVSRELIYAKFLKEHAPNKCNIFLGGFIFGIDGTESKQMDIIISTDTTPKFDFHNFEGKGKSFSPVEGCLGAVSIKSKLDKDQLFDSLNNIASIPTTSPLDKRVNPLIKINDYDDWPLKIIYASDGLTDKTILDHINSFYEENPGIPITRRPDIIHVAGKYVIMKIKKGMSITNIHTGENETPEMNKYRSFITNSDVQAIIWTLNDLQKKATASTHIIFDYSEIINKLNDTN